MMRSLLASINRGRRSQKSSTRSRRPCRPQVESLEDRNLLSGWTQFFPGAGQGTFNNFPGTMLLLSSGQVMINGYNDKTWYLLSPNSSGSYTGGSITDVASMSASRLFYGSAILANGQMMVVGGEYYNGGSADTNPTGEIYNPATNTWGSIASYPTGHFGDDTLELLPNGTVLGTSIFDGQMYAYSQGSNSWSQLASKIGNDASDEEGFVKTPPSASLPQGGLVSYSIFTSQSTYPGGGNLYLPAPGTTGLAQYYDMSGNTWNATGTVPANVRLTSSAIPNQGTPDNNFFELGAGVLLPSNGNVFYVGAAPDYNNSGTALSGAHTGLYNPTTNTWSAGPDLPLGYANDDGPAAVLPDGNVIFTADLPFGHKPTKLLEYNPGTNQITDLTSTLPAQLQNELGQIPGFITRMIMLPTGQLLLSTTFQFGGGQGGELWAYSETGAVSSAWRPKIINITNNSPGAFTLTGQQLNGMDEGSAYGDDVQNATNYPIVRLTSTATGQVYYTTTSSWTQPGEVQTGTQVGTTTFTLPSNLTNSGLYVVNVIANGIASNPATIYISAGEILGTSTAITLQSGPTAPVTASSSGASTLASIGVGVEQATRLGLATGFSPVTGNHSSSANQAVSDLAFARVGSASLGGLLGAGISTGSATRLSGAGAVSAPTGSSGTDLSAQDDLFKLDSTFKTV
jgi:hypothetical protein